MSVYSYHPDNFLAHLHTQAIPGSGPIYAGLCRGRGAATELCLPSETGHVQLWRFHPSPQVDELATGTPYLAEETGRVGLEGCGGGSLFYFGWTSPAHTSLWACTGSGVSRIELERDGGREVGHLSYHELTCCGLTLAPNGRHLAVGDLTGRVFVWEVPDLITGRPRPSTHGSRGPLREIAPRPHYIPKHSSVCPAMVRSVAWRPGLPSESPEKAVVFVGLMSGQLCAWWPFAPLPTEPLVVYENPEATITCIRWLAANSSAPLAADSPLLELFAFSDIRGGLTICRWNNATKTVEELRKVDDRAQQAHVTSKEIWSLAFSPDAQFLATGGEDHTTHVYRLVIGANGSVDVEREGQLGGKSAAVTCVDWQTSPKGSVLLIASDDRTLHCWKYTGTGAKATSPTDGSWADLDASVGWENSAFFRTAHHHLMITYAALLPGDYRVACATMGGHVYLFDMETGKERYHAKTHTGSVEGLAWVSLPSESPDQPNASLLATCSSDCSVHVYSL